MKTTFKVIILILAITLAIGGVMAYAKTRVAPPVKVSGDNPYIADLTDVTDQIKYATSDAAQDSAYFVGTARVKVYLQEHKLEPKEADKQLDGVVKTYAPLFVRRSMAKFDQPAWSDADHQVMLARIAALEAARHSDGFQVLDANETAQLQQISDIISRYRDALRVANSTGFSGVANAQATIAKAREYAADQTLAKCTALHNALGTVRQRIAQSHYNYVAGQVARLANYRNYSQEAYNSLQNQVDAKLSEFENKAQSLYGTTMNAGALRSKAIDYANQAAEYYNDTSDDDAGYW